MHSGSLEADTENRTSSFHFHYTNFNIFLYSKVKKIYTYSLYLSKRELGCMYLRQKSVSPFFFLANEANCALGREKN